MKIVLRKSRFSYGEKRVGDIPIVILSVLIVISEVPILLRNIPNVVYYGLVFLFLLSTINFYIKLNVKKRNVLFLLLLYLALIAFYKFAGISSASYSYYSTIVKYFFFLVVMIGIGSDLTREQKKFLIFVIIASICFTLLQNIQLYLRVGAIRYVSLFQRERFSTNSINTAYTAALLFFGGTLFVVYLHHKNGFIKQMALALTILSILFNAIIAQRMIIVALSVLMYPLLLLFNAKRSKSGIVYSLIVILILFFLFFNYTFTLDLVDKIASSDRMSKRLDQIRSFLALGSLEEAGGSLSARSRLMMQSMRTWVSSFSRFFFGAGDHHTNNLIIGNHSHFLDELARYGLLGTVIWVPLLFSYLKQVAVCAGVHPKTRLHAQFTVIFVIFLLRGFTGGIQEVTVGIQLFLMLPLSFSLLEDKS